jgi:hypothetical protein
MRLLRRASSHRRYQASIAAARVRLPEAEEAMMSNDVVQVCALGNARTTEADFNWERWTSCKVTTGIGAPAEASFELGDDTGWERISRYCDLGAQFVVVVNDRPRFHGRVEALTSATDAQRSSTQSFIVRTKLSDAKYASAPQGMRLKGASIKQFVLACYSSLGLTEIDFDFRGDVSRDLMVGKRTRGGQPQPDLDALREEQAKVSPPETIYTAVDRHLRRHGLLHWDGADGRIVVAPPDDRQEPAMALISLQQPNGYTNNMLSYERVKDVSEAPTVLGVFGVAGGVSFSKAKIATTVINQDLIDRGFTRAVVILDESVRTQAIADRRARREYAGRNRSLDRLSVVVDGLSYVEGGQALPWAQDTTADVVAWDLGGALGSYYIEEVEMTRSPADGDRTRLVMVRQGVWVL